MSSSESPRIRLIHELARGFEKKDTGFLAKHLHKNYRRIFYPRSLGQPEQTREEWLHGMKQNMDLWTGDGEMTIHSIIEASEQLVIHLSEKAKTSVGVDFDRELIFIATVVLDEDGILKLKRLEGFTDSKAELDFFKAVAEAKANRHCAA